MFEPKTYIATGDARSVLRTWPDGFANCCVTSPPYWGLRDYGVGNTGIGLEETLDEHIAALVDVFREVKRVLRADGTLWLNYGDAYAGSWGAQGRGDKRSEMDARQGLSAQQIAAHPKRRQTGSLARTGGCKAKDLMGLPWMLAFALRADGWYLRQDIIWHKPNPMPESVRDRCTKAHEYLFLLSKSEKYYFDSEAMQEPANKGAGGSRFDTGKTDQHQLGRASRKPRAPGNKSHKYVAAYDAADSEEHRTKAGLMKIAATVYETRNKRSVWTVATKPFKEAHFATFPPALVEPCILAGCPPQGIVIDPFGGAGTTGLVAARNTRHSCLIELNPEYAAMARRRIDGDNV